jgi:hypothetical protein
MNIRSDSFTAGLRVALLPQRGVTVNRVSEFMLINLHSCSPVANKLVRVQVSTLCQLICFSNALPLFTSLAKLSIA